MKHLTPAELIDSLDGMLPPEREAHVHACAVCRQERRRLSTVLRDVSSVDMPEPSPLFWDHLSARVRARIEAEPVPSRLAALRADAAAGWTAAWRPSGWTTSSWHVRVGAAVVVGVVCATLGWMARPFDRVGRVPASSLESRQARASASSDAASADPGSTGAPSADLRRARVARGGRGADDRARYADAARGRGRSVPARAHGERAWLPGPAGASGDDEAYGVSSESGTTVAAMPVRMDADWAMMMRMAEDVSWDDGERSETTAEGGSMYLRPGTVEGALNELSSDEQQALVRLLRAELARPRSRRPKS